MKKNVPYIISTTKDTHGKSLPKAIARIQADVCVRGNTQIMSATIWGTEERENIVPQRKVIGRITKLLNRSVHARSGSTTPAATPNNENMRQERIIIPNSCGDMIRSEVIR
jgi:hypothetical protein